MVHFKLLVFVDARFTATGRNGGNRTTGSTERGNKDRLTVRMRGYSLMLTDWNVKTGVKCSSAMKDWTLRVYVPHCMFRQMRLGEIMQSEKAQRDRMLKENITVGKFHSAMDYEANILQLWVWVRYLKLKPCYHILQWAISRLSPTCYYFMQLPNKAGML